MLCVDSHQWPEADGHLVAVDARSGSGTKRTASQTSKARLAHSSPVVLMRPLRANQWRERIFLRFAGSTQAGSLASNTDRSRSPCQPERASGDDFLKRPAELANATIQPCPTLQIKNGKVVMLSWRIMRRNNERRHHLLPQMLP